MTSNKAFRLTVCALALSAFGAFDSAQAQSGQAPFTIRRPPDGASVREKVRIEIPRSSISKDAFVAFYIDGVFQVALAPQEDAASATRPFTFLWDTKAEKTTDGIHTIRAVLYEPAADAGSSIAATEKASSEVKLTVANKIKNGPTSLLLRYKYREGMNLNYDRESKAVIAGGVSETGSSTDTELSLVSSKHLFDVEDTQPEISLVRNKTTSLKILMNGQETTLGPAQLSASLYQELDPLGQVKYETGATTGLVEFTAQGLPVNNTVELPLLPLQRVSIGQTWKTAGQRLDLPGLPPALQPRVVLTNKLEGLEWEGGRPTAKIHQTYEGSPMAEVQFGPIPITTPTITYERDIYLAYESGILVKTARTLTIKGKTTVNLGGPTQAAGGAAMAGMGRGGMMGMMGMPPGMMGSGGAPGASGSSMMNMMMNSSRGAGMNSGRPGGRGGFPGMGGAPGSGAGRGGMMGSGGMMGRPGGRGGFPGSGSGRGGVGRGGDDDDRGGGRAGMGSGGMMGSGAMMGGRGGMMGMPPGMGRGMGTIGGAMGTQDPDKPVTVKAVTNTELAQPAKTTR